MSEIQKLSLALMELYEKESATFNRAKHGVKFATISEAAVKVLQEMSIEHNAINERNPDVSLKAVRIELV